MATADDNTHSPTFNLHYWRCPACGEEATLEDVIEMMLQEGGLKNDIVLEITRSLLRFHCSKCGHFFGEQELKDKILSP